MLLDETKLFFVAQFVQAKLRIESTWFVTFNFKHLLKELSSSATFVPFIVHLLFIDSSLNVSPSLLSFC